MFGLLQIGFMAQYGAAIPCLGCRERLQQDGPLVWSSTIRHFPDNRAVAVNSMCDWLTRLARGLAVCNDCASLINLIAVELILIIGNL